MDMPVGADFQPVVSSIAAVRQTWLDSVRAGDTERLASMVADDIVVVHSDGRCVRGRDELKADFQKGFEAFLIDQRVDSAEIVLRGQWAFEISEIRTKLTPRTGTEPKQFHSTTVVALRRQPDGSWKIRRVLGLLD